MAAVLACGPGTLLGHLWGAWNYGLWRLPVGPVHVVCPRSRHARAGIIVHRCRSLAETDHDHNHGIPTTSPARTILDCAPLLAPKARRRLVNDAQIARLTTAEALRDIVARSNGRRTSALLAEVPLDQYGATRSLLEDLLVDFCRELSTPMPLINHLLHGIECDFSYPDRDLVIEADGFTTHSTRSGFESDHDRRLALEALGVRVVAVTYRQMTAGYPRTRRQLERVIEASGAVAIHAH